MYQRSTTVRVSFDESSSTSRLPGTMTHLPGKVSSMCEVHHLVSKSWSFTVLALCAVLRAHCCT